MVKNAQEALFIACEMERRAVKMYQRGAMLFPHLKEPLQNYEMEERTHLKAFQMMGDKMGGLPHEDQMLLSAYAASVLFPGGLMEASRENAFSDLASFLNYAAGQEQEAIRRYTAFAEDCADEEAKNMFLAIAHEEEGHYAALVAKANDK